MYIYLTPFFRVPLSAELRLRDPSYNPSIPPFLGDTRRKAVWPLSFPTKSSRKYVASRCSQLFHAYIYMGKQPVFRPSMQIRFELDTTRRSASSTSLENLISQHRPPIQNAIVTRAQRSLFLLYRYSFELPFFFSHFLFFFRKIHAHTRTHIHTHTHDTFHCRIARTERKVQRWRKNCRGMSDEIPSISKR